MGRVDAQGPVEGKSRSDQSSKSAIWQTSGDNVCLPGDFGHVSTRAGSPKSAPDLRIDRDDPVQLQK
jgi:hypothetical protein